MTVAEKERAALAGLFGEVGPDAPTRCEGWQSEDLLIHLLIRERRPDATVGEYLSIAKPWTERVSGGYRRRPWPDLVQEFRKRPGLPNPVHFAAVDEAMNGGEYFIHHEDLRRGRPGWEPRDLDAETTAMLTKLVKSSFIRFGLRKAGVGVVAVLPDGERVVLRKGEPAAVVTGAPGEIVIWASGRPAARVEFSGDDGAIAQLERAGLRVDPSLW